MVLFVADDNRVMKQVQRAWVFDGSRWNAANCAWVQTTNPVPVKDPDCIGFINVVAAAQNHITLGVQWSAPGADKVDIIINGVVKYTIAAATGQQSITNLVPTSTVTVIVKSYVGSESFESTPKAVVMPPMPAPTGLTNANVTNTSYEVWWNPVAGANHYDIFNADNNVKIAASPDNGEGIGGLTPSTTYRNYVKSVHAQGGSSAPSGVLSTSTSARFTPGTYEFFATSADTWEGDGHRWRGTSEGKMWHGDGYAFGASGGSRYSFFFGHNRGGVSIPNFFASQGAVTINVSLVQFYAHRSATQHGIYSAQTNRFFMHNHASKPTTPSNSTGGWDTGSLALGQSGWFSVPLDWGRALISQSDAHKGVTWGGWGRFSDGRGYMYGPTLPGDAQMGGIRITVS